MPKAGIEPATRGFSVLCSTNWAIWAHSHKRENCGGRIWTYDLRVMSPTSFQTAPPRDILLILYKIIIEISIVILMGGGGFEPPKQVAADLQSVPFGHSGIRPYMMFLKNEPMIGLEPITCWLQISCSANWATSAYLLQLICNQLLCLRLTRSSSIAENWATLAYLVKKWGL